MSNGRRAAQILLLMALAALLWALSGQAQAWAQPEYRALVIGNGDYRYLNGLGAGPGNDGAALEAALKDARLAHPVNISRKADLSLTAMRSALKTAFAGADEDDVSIFFYSGHGALMDGRAYLCPVDAKDSASTMLSMDELRRALDQTPGQKIVILDSCYSGGAIARGARSPSGQEFNAQAVRAFASPMARTTMAKQGYKVITASSAKEQSFVTNWAVSGGAARLSCLSGCLAQGLGARFSAANGFSAAPGGEIAADLNRDQTVSLSELHTWLTAQMRQIDGLSNVQVYPQHDTGPLLNYGAAPVNQNPVMSQSLAQGAVKQGQPAAFQAHLAAPVKAPRLNVYQRRYMGGPLNLVRSMALGPKAEGAVSALWDGKDDSGAVCPAGSYFLGLSGLDGAGKAFEAQSMALLTIVMAPTAPKAQLKPPLNQMAMDGQNEIALEVENPGPDYIAQRYTLTIQNERGARVRPLVRDEMAARSFEDEGGFAQARYINRFYWDGKDDQGTLCPPGRYKAVLRAEYLSQTLTRTGDIELLSLKSARVTALSGSAVQFKLDRPGARMTISGVTNAPGALNVEVYDAQGALTARILAGYHPGGAFSAQWDGIGLSGGSVKSGGYTLRASLNGQIQRQWAFKVKAGAAAPSFSNLKVKGFFQGGKLSYSLRMNGRGRVRAGVYSPEGEKLADLPSFSANRGNRSRDWKNSLTPGRYVLKVQTQNLKSGCLSKPKQAYFIVKPQPDPAISKLSVSGKNARYGKYTYFRFYANRSGRYTITLYDGQGNRLANLRTAKACSKGNHGLKLYLKQGGKYLPKGRYILGVRLESGGQISPEKRVGIRVK